jgi:hypothetical protein
MAIIRRRQRLSSGARGAVHRGQFILEGGGEQAHATIKPRSTSINGRSTSRPCRFMSVVEDGIASS